VDLVFSSRRRTHTKAALRFAQAADDLRSLFLLYERVRDLFASVDGGDDDEEGAACDNQAEFAIPNVAFVVWAMLARSMWFVQTAHTCQCFLDLIQHEVH